MNGRFAPGWPIIEQLIDALVDNGAEQYLINAFATASNVNLSDKCSVDDLKGTLRKWIVAGDRIPWVFYDTIAEAVRNSPQGLQSIIIEKAKFNTRARELDYEKLQVTNDGRWQVAWEIDPTEEIGYREVALDWYLPPNLNTAPIVPIHIIDYIAGCIILLRQELVLPAVASLLVAFESSLWHALAEAEGGTGFTREVTYKPVTWHAKKSGGKIKPCLIIEVSGATRHLKDTSPINDFDLEVRRMQSKAESPTVNIVCQADSSIVDYLATDRVETDKERTDRGLGNALEKGRSIKIDCLKKLDPQMDQTLIALRNNLAHLPFQDEEDELRPRVPFLERELRTLGELRNNKRQIQGLAHWVIEVINSAYAPRLEEIEVEET